MGAGSFALWMWGMTLTESEADVVYGLVGRMNERRTGHGVPMPVVPRNESAARPQWVGFEVQRYPGLDVPEHIRYHALRFDDAQIGLVPECPHHGLDVAFRSWRAFTDWLKPRNVYLPYMLDREGMFFVSDYD